MNPLDARAPRWSPFLEARNPRDFDMMAAALIPQQKDTVDPFWVTAARQLFSNGAGVLRQKGIAENRVLVDHLLKTDLTALAEAMEGTVAQSIVDPDNPKTALSVRAMLTANLSALEFLPDEGKPFSIREWISDEDRDGFLFLTSRGDQHASLRGLISTWLEIAVNAMLSLAQDDGRRIWVILDELPTLHQVPSLQPGLAESRQFGGCFVLGVQVASALRDLYGQERGGDHLRAVRHARGAGRAGPGHRAVVGRQPRPQRNRGGLRGVLLRRQHHPRRGEPHAPQRAQGAGAALRDHAPGEPLGLSQVPRPLPGRLHPPEIRRPAEGGGAVRAARRRWGGTAKRCRRGRQRRDRDPGAAGPGRLPPRRWSRCTRHASGAGGPARRARSRAAAGRGRRSATGRGGGRNGEREGDGCRWRGARAGAAGRCTGCRFGTGKARARPTPAAAAGRTGADMLSIGALSSAAQGASYYERDGYYAKDDPEHRDASGWAGKGAEELGLKGPVDPDTFRAVLEGKVPDGSDTRLGRRGKDGEILHRPGRDLTFSAPKSVSLAALVGGDRRIVEAHDRAVAATLAWVEKNAAETRMKDPDTGKMARVGNQKIVAATFRHDTSRNLDPQLHTHAVLANMVQGEDGKWRSMANEGCMRARS